MRRVTPARAVLSAILIALVLFCAYGFLATFEPGPRAVPFRIGYAALGLVALAASGWLLFKR